MRVLPFLLVTAALTTHGAIRAEPAGAPAPGDFARSPDLPDDTPAEIEAELLRQSPVTSLAEALRRTYWSNPTLLAQRAATRGVDYRVPQARAAYGPRLGATATYGWQSDAFEITPGQYSRQEGWASTAQAVLTQPLITFGRGAAGEQFALAQLDYQRNVLRSGENQALLDAITAYVGVLRDRDGVAIAQDNLTLLEQELRDNQQRLKVREVTATDLQQVETRVELGRAQLLSARRAAAGSEAAFLRTIGAPAGQAAAPPNPLALPVRTLEEAYGFAESNNPALFAAKAREKASRAQVASARADLRPRVDLRGSAEYGTISPYSSDLRRNTLRGEVQLTAPLYEGALRTSRLAELQAANDADWRLLDAAFRDNRAALADIWSEWQAQAGAVDRYAAAVDSARKAYDGALLQERAGLRTTLDVLDLARELLSARTAYNSAVANVTVAKARVLFAMGSLDYGWLQPDADRYDADLHFRRVRSRGDLPLLTPLIRAIDRSVAGSANDRPLRDPAALSETAGMTVEPEGDR